MWGFLQKKFQCDATCVLLSPPSGSDRKKFAAFHGGETKQQDSDSKAKGLRVHGVKLIGTPAKPKGLKGTHYICYNIDMSQVASGHQCVEPQREGKRAHKAFMGIEVDRCSGSGESRCSCQRELIGKISLRHYQRYWNLSSMNCVWQNIIISNSYSTLSYGFSWW